MGDEDKVVDAAEQIIDDAAEQIVVDAAELDEGVELRDEVEHDDMDFAVELDVDEPAQPEPELSLEDAIEQRDAALTKAEQNWDLLLRGKAELENLKRRQSREIENAHKYGLERFINDLLPMVDSLDMGLLALSQQEISIDNVKQGYEMTLQQLGTALEKHKVEIIDPVNDKFDPNRHQAVSMIPSEDVAPNTVISVMQKGYMLNERLLRPAMTVVAGPPVAKNDDETP